MVTCGIVSINRATENYEKLARSYDFLMNVISFPSVIFGVGIVDCSRVFLVACE